jgi:uncharacterized 2Fe-2S/4Fe-4S cluster protein (DUF4445 family)
MNVRYEVISNSGHSGRPCGVCGSGLIDFLAEAFRTGLIERTGRFNRDVAGRCPRFTQVSFRGHPVSAFVLVPKDETDDGSDDIVISERYQGLCRRGRRSTSRPPLAKNAGLTLKRHRPDLAGWRFAWHINVRNAITIGMLPDLPSNGSTRRAHVARRGVRRTSGSSDPGPSSSDRACLRVVDFNKDPEFKDEYMYALFLPNPRRRGSQRSGGG